MNVQLTTDAHETLSAYEYHVDQGIPHELLTQALEAETLHDVWSVQAYWDAAFEYASQGDIEAAEDVLRTLLDDEILSEAYLNIRQSSEMISRR